MRGSMMRAMIALGLAAVLPGCGAGGTQLAAGAAKSPPLFETSERCMACHNGLTTADGEDVSIGTSWRATMMANSARDPYWQASVRAETLDHPELGAAIQDECAVCHMPMMRYQAHANGEQAEVFAHLPIDAGAEGPSALAADGVGCTVCHQILDTQFGQPESFSGRFTVDQSLRAGRRPVYGPYDIDEGRRGVMHSSSQFIPAKGTHVRASELCATCHTLYTQVHDAAGKVVGRLPEQVPYQEWKHSGYQTRVSCQSCHMPPVEQPMPIASVLGQPREQLGRHDFRGGNFFMLNLLNRYRDELGVVAQPQEMATSVRKTIDYLRESTARVTIDRSQLNGDRIEAVVEVKNLSGHKLPTAYPSRRAWLHVTVRDRDGHAVFESGAVAPDGSIAGNDNDLDRAVFEPHYREISQPGQVQIYESVLADTAGRVTTGLLSAVRYLKDNRLLPDGFDKATAHADIAVQGEALGDPDFVGGGDRVTYVVPVPRGAGPYTFTAALRFQPIAFRWARNLERHPGAAEVQRFAAQYGSMAHVSSIMIHEVSATVR
ncbi:MAG: hypothetical protein IT361_04420 [Gemmatimonadaceae bacterium]|nr:hypothetical protein [Gemmatimonadaceae bacterium]